MNKTIIDNGVSGIATDSGRFAVFKSALALLLFLSLLISGTIAFAQKIDLRLNDAAFRTVIKELQEKQPDFSFSINGKHLRQANPVSLNLRQVEFMQALEQVFRNQPFTYRVDGKQIVSIDRKPTTNNFVAEAQEPIHGRVTDSLGRSIPNVSVQIVGSRIGTVTNRDGYYELTSAAQGNSLSFSIIGFNPVIKVIDNTQMDAVLQMVNMAIDEVSVVHTGYQSLPKERATGSFVQLDNEIINRRVSTNILDRLEGITSGLIFNKNQLAGNEKTGIAIRGRSTLDINVNADPLIVVDNFPFEGDLSSINPNDIESITVLKDAAAASIWGSRAGNGVIVLTTKKAKFNQPLNINFNANATIGSRPDLYYSRGFISAPEFIEAERTLFNQGFYDANINDVTSYPSLSPAVEIFLAQKNGKISQTEAENQLNELKLIDTRYDVSRYFYRNSINQQYALSLQGGTANSNYMVSGGYDNNKTNLVKNGQERLTLNTTGNFILLPNLTLTTGLNFYQNSAINNSQGLGYGSITGLNGILQPYARLVDNQGNALPLTQNLRNSYIEGRETIGFLDWQYRPYDELGFADNTNKANNLIFRSALNYKFLKHFNASLQYQWENQKRVMRNHQSTEAFFTRDLINRYTQVNTTTGALSYPLPNGGILDLNNFDLTASNWRGQLNYEQAFADKHAVNAIGGFEVREIKTENYARRSYGYNDEFGTAVTNINYDVLYVRNPNGSQRIPAVPSLVGGTLNRYISYYGNGAYTYDKRYTISASARRDGANIFGVKTNDKITPLWSIGGLWHISNEQFYHVDFLPLLRLRTTYGYNGNVYNASAYLTAQYSTSSFTGERYATVTSPPNASLRWEQVKNINIGLDFASASNRLSGSVEWYKKEGIDLIATSFLAPSSGFTTYKGNTAATVTRGIDVQLNSINLNGAFKWNSSLLFNYLTDKVTKFNLVYSVQNLVGGLYTENTSSVESSGLLAVIGKPLYGIYSYQWAGLDPTNGDPQGYLDGEISKDYLAIIQSAEPESLIFHGSARPTTFGNLINTFSWKSFSLTANVSYKFGYFFRKPTTSLNLQEIIVFGGYNRDYEKRWQNKGDESVTSLPSIIYPSNANRSAFYRGSEVNVLKGDHIRLQDITLSYDFRPGSTFTKLKSLRVYAYINNIGLLWKANKENIDPDFAQRYAIPNPRTFALGIRAGI